MGSIVGAVDAFKIKQPFSGSLDIEDFPLFSDKFSPKTYVLNESKINVLVSEILEKYASQGVHLPQKEEHAAHNVQLQQQLQDMRKRTKDSVLRGIRE